MEIRDRIRELRRVKASELVPHPGNWRTHPSGQQDALRGVLAEIGYADALICRELPDGRLGLLDGHLRADTTPEMEVPVLVVDLDEAEAKKLLATLDPLAAMAEANKDALGKLLHDIETDSEGLQEMLDGLAVENGIDPFESGGEEEAPEPQLDRAAELQKEWGTELGQLWEIPGKAGVHRLLCGDSTKAEDVQRVMGGERADAVATDPPYGINQPGVPHDSPQEHAGLISRAVTLLPCDNSVVVAFQSTRTFPTWLDAARDAGFTFERILCLYKEAQCAYPWRGWLLTSEAILVFSVGDASWQDVKPYAHDTYKVAAVQGELVPAWHGSIKPVAIVQDILSRICAGGAIVFDPFLGSGTTMVAAEQLGRVCYGIEIEPKYVAVALQRMKDMGLEPRLTT